MIKPLALLIPLAFGGCDWKSYLDPRVAPPPARKAAVKKAEAVPQNCIIARLEYGCRDQQTGHIVAPDSEMVGKLMPKSAAPPI